MKQILIFFLVVFSAATFSQKNIVKAKVSEKTELLSIIFRLAEAEEYTWNDVKSYNNDIDEYFSEFRNHNVIKLAKKVRKINGVGYIILELMMNTLHK